MNGKRSVNLSIVHFPGSCLVAASWAFIVSRDIPSWYRRMGSGAMDEVENTWR